MPLERKRHEDEEPGGAGSGLHIDLDDRVCASCREDVPAWVPACPNCGGAVVRREELPPADDPLLRRLLDRGEDEGPASA